MDRKVAIVGQMGLFSKWKASNAEFTHEAFERGEASFADEEGDKIVPTMIAEASMVIDDEQAIEAEVERVSELESKGGPELDDARIQLERAEQDVQDAKMALSQAQDLEDKADEAYKNLNSQFKHDGRRESIAFVTQSTPKYGEPGASVDQEHSTVTEGRESIEADQSAVSKALADADAAKVAVDEDLKKATPGT